MGTSLRTLFGRSLPNRTTVARALVLIAVGMVALLPNPAILQAALFTWTGPGGNQFDPASGNWNVAANWIGGLPPTNNAETDLSFAGSSATPYTSTHNLGLMLVNDLSLSSSATVTETIAASGGSSLRFVNDGFGTDPTITQNGTGAFAINVPIDVAAPLTVVYGFGATGAVTLGGNLTGSGNLTTNSQSQRLSLILSGDNSGYSGTITVAPPSGTSLADRSLAVLSARSPNALGTGNLHLIGATGQTLTPGFATAVLEIGADLDGGGNGTDFSRAVGNGPGQINMTGPDEKASFGFAARGAARVVNLGGNAVPTTLTNKQPFLPFGDADGYAFGSPTADNTLVFMNPIDFLDSDNRDLRTIRGVGNVPEGRQLGTISNSVNNQTYRISGNGGVILDNVTANTWQAGSVTNPIIGSGGVFLAVSDPALPTANSPLGRNNNAITIGVANVGNATPLGSINTGVMTYGPGNSGGSATPIITIARNFVIGTGGSGIMSVGGFTADHTRFSGNINLNGVSTRFTARTGGRVEFSGVVSNSGTLTIGDTVIEGDDSNGIAGISVPGRGVVVLSGNNTYASGTEVTHGTLLVNNTAGSGTGTGLVAVQSGATLGGSGTIVPDIFNTVSINTGGILSPHTTPTGTSALTIANNGLTLNGGTVLNYNIGAPGVSDVVHLTGPGNNLALFGANTLNLANVGGLTVATYPIITHSGGSVVGGGGITVGTNPGLGFNYAVVQTPNQVELRVTSSATLKTWTGSASNVWSTTAANFAPSNYVNGDQVLFSNTGNPANSNINITAPVSPAFITIDNGGAVATYTLGGAAITGTTGITKTGTGTLVLSGANTYSGVTSVVGGTLRATNTSGSATGTGLVAIASGATLSGSGTISPTGANTVIVGGGGHVAPHLTPTTANTLTIGSNGLTLRDASILDFNFGAVGNHDRVVLSGAGNTLTLEGTTTLNVSALAGFGTGLYPMLEFGARAGGLGSVVLGSVPTGDLVFNLVNNPTNIALAVAATKTWSGAVDATWNTSTPNWRLGGGSATFSNGDAVRFDNSYTGPNRNITVAAPVSVATILAGNLAGNDYTIGGASIGGPGGVIKTGTGTFALNNANTFTGKTSITGGTLSINSAASLGTEPAAATADAITIDGATLSATGSAAFGANRGITLGANNATINIANAAAAVSVPGLVSGPGGLTVTGAGRLVLGNQNNTFANLTINDATVEARPPVGQNVVMNNTAASGLLGNNAVPLIIDGGTLKLSTTVSAQNITIGRVLQFGPDGGTVDLRDTLGGTLGGAAGNGAGGGGGGDMRIDLTNTVGPVVFQWNGGQSGLSTNTVANGDWAEGSNNLRWATVTQPTAGPSPPMRIELNHAGMTTIRAEQFGSYSGPFTLRGGVGGDVTAAGNQVTEIGRVQISGTGTLFNFSAGMFLEDSLQFNLAGNTRTFDNEITLRGVANGHPANVTFNGRATGTAFSGAQQTFQLTLGTIDNPNNRTLTVEKGATANFDVRVRTDQPNSNGVEVTSKLDLKAGATARARQSWLGLSVGGSDRPVGYVEIFGDIVGNGNAVDGDSVFEVQLPHSDRVQTRVNEGGVTFRGGSAAQFEARLVVNGDNSGSGAGLLIRGAPRDTKLYTVNNQQGAAALAFPVDPISNVTKLSGNPDSVATAARLAALTGTGGYLTLAAVGETFPFPVGGEWAANVPVGLKVINSNATGDDVSLSAAFQHNLNVDFGATFNSGGVTLGPASATAGLGLIKGLGTIGGSPVFAGGATVAPGFGLGTLGTAGTPTINGTLQIEANGTAHDQLNVYGNLVLGASSVLNLPAGNVYDGSKAYIIAAYTGTRTGTFGSTSAMPAGYTLNYGTGTNSYIRLVPGNPLNEWLRTSGGSWHTAANWAAGVVPNSNADTARLWTGLLIDDVIDIGATNTTVKSLSFRNGFASYSVVSNSTGRLILSSNSGNASVVFESGNLKDHSVLSGLTLASNTDISLGSNSLLLAGQQNWGGRSVTVNSGLLRYLSSAAGSNTAGASLTIAPAGSVELGGTASPTSDGVNHVNVTNNGQLNVITAQAVGNLGGTGDLVVAAGGTLAANHIRQDSVNIAGDTTIRVNGGDGGTSAVNSLTIGATNKLDLNDNDLIVRAAAATKDAVHANIQAKIISAQNGLDANFITNWNGPGITSSAARNANLASNFDLVGLGAIRNSDIDVLTGLPGSSYTTFSGQAVAPDDILVKYTYIGDGNLDGLVSFDDYVGMDNAFFGLIPNLGWATGDINFDGVINFDDYTVVDQAFFFQGAPLGGGDAVAAVPEPGSVLLGLAALALFALFGVAKMRRRV